MSLSPLKELHDGSDMWTICVRVVRKWNVYQKSAPTELFCVSLLLLDSEGTQIQASVLNKTMHKRFLHDIKEGNSYEMANFVVSPNTYKFRPTTHPFKITLTPYTSISETESTIPLYSYSFKTISELLSLNDNDHIDYLFDVIAFVSSIGTLEEDQRDSETKYRMRMVLQDAQSNDIECVLWDNCASDAYLAQLQNSDTPVVALLNLARLGCTDSITVNHFDSASGEIVKDDADMTIIDLSQNVTQAPTKGKRKNYVKRPVNKVDCSTLLQPSSQMCPDDRLLKTIKQEK